PVLAQSAGERLAEHIARLAAEGPAGDEGVAHAIYRTYEIRRARRLALRRETGAATLALSRALIDPSPVELAALEGAHGTIDPARIAPVVPRPGFGTNRADAVREAAVLLAALGAPDRALELLEAHRREDPRAILQAGHIALSDGRPDVAAAALAEFEAAAPSLASEGTTLRARLGQ
ncbi:MAG: hypothetical protein JRH11_26785, partial [Deltaproteobacteria bacterium]|nr:hypothetical protein [Deltaproteobacteria bacterium]